jgi:hypothetical protein
MKKIILFAIPALALGLLSPQFAQAQGTLYVSNLGLTSSSSSPVGNDSWLAVDFRTGTNAAGYSLNSFQLALADASGNPSGFTAMLYTLGGYANPGPGSSLGTLNGSLSPVTGGIYTYSPASNLTLSRSATYFIVLTAATAVADGAYEWSVTSTHTFTLSGGWNGSADFFSSSDGSNWRQLGGPYPQFAIYATDLPVPEPSTLGLLALGGCFLLWRRRKVKAVNATFFASP